MSSGALVIIGGAEDREGECLVLREFVRAAGGVKARIAVMTAATTMPKEVGDDYIRIFERLGAESVEVVHTEHRDDSDYEPSIRKVEEATGIFFTGGDQSRIVDFVKDTRLDQVPSAYEPMGEVKLRGRVARGFAGGRVPWGVLMTGWAMFGCLAFAMLHLAIATSLLSAWMIFAVTLIPLFVLWKGTAAKLSDGDR